MKRTLTHNDVVVRLNELEYRGAVYEAVITQGPEWISKIVVTMAIDEIATVDEDGNVLTVNKNARDWEEWAEMQLEESD